MTTRRRFGGEFKARVALEALRGDKTVQEIASKHKVHPNQVSTWKRQAIDGLSKVFSNGTDRERQDRETEVRELHAIDVASSFYPVATGVWWLLTSCTGVATGQDARPFKSPAPWPRCGSNLAA